MVVDAVVDVAFCNYEAVRIITPDNEIRHAFLIYRSDRVIGDPSDANFSQGGLGPSPNPEKQSSF
jgi:hypothetical protein